MMITIRFNKFHQRRPRLNLLSSKLTIILVILNLSFNAHGKQAITYGAISFPPTIVKNLETGECTGPTVSFVQTVFAESNLGLETVCGPPARIFKLIQSGEADFTINIKSTSSLLPYVEFLDPPFTMLQVKFYSHTEYENELFAAAIRGYEYSGMREVLKKEGYSFIDFPDSDSAIQFFLKGRVKNLLSYRAPYDYFLRSYGNRLGDKIAKRTMIAIPTHFAIARNSKNLKEVKAAIKNYARAHKVSVFTEHF